MTPDKAIDILIEQANARKLNNRIVANGIAVETLRNIAKLYTPEIPLEIQREFGDFVVSCPRCENPIMNVWSNTEYKPNYCHFCGQRLEWSKSKDD